MNLVALLAHQAIDQSNSSFPTASIVCRRLVVRRANACLTDATRLFVCCWQILSFSNSLYHTIYIFYLNSIAYHFISSLPENIPRVQPSSLIMVIFLEAPSGGLQGFIRFYSIIFRSIQMNFEEAEIEQTCSPQGKGKVLGVIVITDNRHAQSQQKSTQPDYRCSGFKETEVDPLESALNQNSCTFEDSLLSQLARRVTDLQERVKVLANYEGPDNGSNGNAGASLKRKNRRKFKDLVRNQKCPECQKLYGSQTSLKYHIKLKHSNAKQEDLQSN